MFRRDLKLWEENLNLILTVDGADGEYDGPVGLVTGYIPGLELENPFPGKGYCGGTAGHDAFFREGAAGAGI